MSYLLENLLLLSSANKKSLNYMSRLFISIIGALLLFLTACSNEEPQLEKKNLIVDSNVPKLRYPGADAMATVDYMMFEFYEKTPHIILIYFKRVWRQDNR